MHESRSNADALVAVAMSGGVDSSVVAAMLHRDGVPLVGLTMQLWNQRRLPGLAPEGGASGRCCSLDDVYDARQVAQHVGIPYYVVNFEKRFEEQVVKPFVEDYPRRTHPHPVHPLQQLRQVDDFIDLARGLGAETIATGHYARIGVDPQTGRHQLLRAVDPAKDQTYFLFGLTQPQLARTRFPLGGFTKPQVRQMAFDFGIPVAAKNDSQEICFVPNGDYAAFIDAYFREQGIDPARAQGEIVDTGGRVLGEHAGVHRYTVGQRKGIGVAAAEPLYVIATEPATQRVIVGSNDDLLCGRFEAARVNWISIAPPAAPVRASVRIRNKHIPAAATLQPLPGDRVRVQFDEPQRAVTPGQGAVFYDGDRVLGGGWIESK
ncbi:MAG: tRNA 2-thiouridine(34) synthase MnmA [Bryobacteraceae bacterium]